jgi:hypothetical protein
MVRFGPDLGHSSLNIRKITGRSDMYPEPVVQCNSLFVLNVLKVAVWGWVRIGKAIPKDGLCYTLAWPSRLLT